MSHGSPSALDLAFFPPPPLFFFQSHRCEEREGKRASEDQRTEAEERSYGRFFFFFVCVCVCVFASSLTLLVSHSGCRVSRRSSGVSFMSTWRGREKKSSCICVRDIMRVRRCVSCSWHVVPKLPATTTQTGKQNKKMVFFFVSCCTLHISLFLSPSVLKTGFLTSTTSVFSLFFFCFLVRLFHLQPFFFSEK